MDNKLEVLQSIKEVPGAVSTAEMMAVYDTITKYLICPKGGLSFALDFGSHAGKSSIVGAAALSNIGRKDMFCMIDPVYDLSNESAWKHTIQGSSDKMPWGYCRKETFKEDVRKRVVRHTDLGVRLIGQTSIKFLEDLSDVAVSYVFIDSDDHQIELIMREVELLETMVMVGGIIMFHDFENQYTSPATAANWLVAGGNYEKLSIDWDYILTYVKAVSLEIGNDTWQNPNADRTKVDEIPNFVGAVRRIK